MSKVEGNSFTYPPKKKQKQKEVEGNYIGSVSCSIFSILIILDQFRISNLKKYCMDPLSFGGNRKNFYKIRKWHTTIQMFNNSYKKSLKKKINDRSLMRVLFNDFIKISRHLFRPVLICYTLFLNLY